VQFLCVANDVLLYSSVFYDDTKPMSYDRCRICRSYDISFTCYVDNASADADFDIYLFIYLLYGLYTR